MLGLSPITLSKTLYHKHCIKTLMLVCLFHLQQSLNLYWLPDFYNYRNKVVVSYYVNSVGYLSKSIFHRQPADFLFLLFFFFFIRSIQTCHSFKLPQFKYVLKPACFLKLHVIYISKYFITILI